MGGFRAIGVRTPIDPYFVLACRRDADREVGGGFGIAGVVVALTDEALQVPVAAPRSGQLRVQVVDDCTLEACWIYPLAGVGGCAGRARRNLQRPIDQVTAAAARLRHELFEERD